MKNKRQNGFTLIEMLVVIGIIALLISLLLPALAIARKQARIAETTAELKGLTANIEMYYVTFGAYPGPVPSVSTTSNTATSSGAAGTKVSGNQNLYMGLSYALNLTAPATSVSVPGSSPTLYIDPTSPSGPQDLGNFQMVGTSAIYRQSPPFYSGANREISPSNSSTTWPAGGIAGATAINNFGFPVILDRFSDPLPILYYRRLPQTDGSGTGAGQTIVGTAKSPAAQTTPYNLNDNLEYTSATALKSPSGSAFNQTLGMGASTGAQPQDDLSSVLAHPITGAAIGSYALISAGPDRIYGTYNGKRDDIASVGGP